MAILTKRKSTKQLPNALEQRGRRSGITSTVNQPLVNRQGTDRVSPSAGFVNPYAKFPTSGFTSTTSKVPAQSKPSLTSTTQATRPAATGVTAPSLAARTALSTKPSLTTKTTKPSITSTTTPAAVTSKPAVTSTTAPKSITTPTPAPKPTISKPAASKPSTGSKIATALTGAALGVGAKSLLDRVLGTATKTGAKTGTGSAAGSVTKAATSAVKGAVDKTPTSVVKPAVTPEDTAPADTQDWRVDSDGRVFDNDGVYMGTMDKDGNLIPAEDAGGSNETFIPTPDDRADISELDKLGVGSEEGASPPAEEDLSVDGEPSDLVYSSTTGSPYAVYEVGDNGELYNRAGQELNSDGSIKNQEPSTVGTRGLTPTSQDTTAVASNSDQLFSDNDGNLYRLNSEGGYDLVAEAGSYTNNDGVYSFNDSSSGSDWNVDDAGRVYDGDGVYQGTMDADGYLTSPPDETVDDTTVADDTDYYSNNYADNTYYDDSEFAKTGGLITMMKQGGVAHYAGGGGAVDQTEPNEYGEYTVSYADGSTETYDETGEVIDSTEATNDTVSSLIYQGYQDNADGTFSRNDDNGNVETVDADGNLISTSDADGIITGGLDSTGQYRNYSTAIQPTGSSGTGTPRVTNTPANTGILNSIKSALGSNIGAAGAGALVASLLGGSFGGGSGQQNQGVDMSKVGNINPRTTDFGIGPANFVGYDQYGTSENDYEPNAELLHNLNAPGYNPVNEGDYGYAEDVANETEEPAKMSSGGLSSMATPVSSYYTFGQPADILANLGMRPQPPQAQMTQVEPPKGAPQAQPQGGMQPPPQGGLTPPPAMPPQNAPQGVPQQGTPPQMPPQAPRMRQGGLPHTSNVPLVDGRMDFRNGSAVHGEGDGQSDDIPAMLADGEYVIDAETVAQIGNGSTKAGAQALDKFREGIRAHKRSAPVNKIPPKTKALTSYLKGIK